MPKHKTLRQWTTLSRRVLLDQGRFLKVEEHEVELPDGRTIPDWPWVCIPDAVIILPMTPEGNFLCFRQTKYAVEGTTLAPVGGMIEPDEKPLTAAKRELLEEMGCEAPEWINLGHFILDPNRKVAEVHLFLAKSAKMVTAPVSDDLEDQEILQLSQADLEKALFAGEFKVLSWSTVAALSLHHIKDRGSCQETIR